MKLENLTINCWKGRLHKTIKYIRYNKSSTKYIILQFEALKEATKYSTL